MAFALVCVDVTAPSGELGEPMPVGLFAKPAEAGDSAGIAPEGISEEPVSALVGGADPTARAKHLSSVARVFWQSQLSTASTLGS